MPSSIISIIEILEKVSLDSRQFYLLLKWLQRNFPQMFHSLQPFFEKKQLLLDFMPIKLSIKSKSKLFVNGGICWVLLRKLVCKPRLNYQTQFDMMYWIMSQRHKLQKLLNPICVETLTGHRNYISSVAFHINGSLLATASDDQNVKLWRPKNYSPGWNCVADLSGHKWEVKSVVFHQIFDLLASCSHDNTNTAKLWRLSSDNFSATCIATLDGHSRYNINSVAFHPTAPILATGSDDRTAKLWRLSPDNSSAISVETLQGHSNWVQSVAFHPTAPLLATGSADRTAKLWRLSSDNSSATCVATLEGHRNYINSVAFHPTAPF